MKERFRISLYIVLMLSLGMTGTAFATGLSDNSWGLVRIYRLLHYGKVIEIGKNYFTIEKK